MSSALIDDSRSGSPIQQALVGIVGIVLAVILIVGQISVAMTRGVSVNLHRNVKHLQDGNATLRDIVEKAGPALLIEKVVAQQQKTLQGTLDTMRVLNGEMEVIGETTTGLSGTVGSMQERSTSLAGGVAGMNRDTEKIVGMLGPLPDATTRTHTQLARIESDSAAINSELGAIGTKMRGYGLPQAQGVRGR